MALKSARSHGARAIQNPKVARLTSATAGRNQATNRSACCCNALGASRASATAASTASSRREPCAGRRSKVPSMEKVPASTGSPGPRGTGRHSPVIEVSCT